MQQLFDSMFLSNWVHIRNFVIRNCWEVKVDLKAKNISILEQNQNLYTNTWKLGWVPRREDFINPCCTTFCALLHLICVLSVKCPISRCSMLRAEWFFFYKWLTEKKSQIVKVELKTFWPWKCLLTNFTDQVFPWQILTSIKVS